MTFGQIWILEKFGEQLSELPPQKLFPLGEKGGRHFGRNGHIIRVVAKKNLFCVRTVVKNKQQQVRC
jgi:hypothetical protein